MIRNQRGQMVVETMLILIVLLFFAGLYVQSFRKMEFTKNLIANPWKSMAGMLQNGVWGAPDKTHALHPNGHGRHISLEGDKAL